MQPEGPVVASCAPPKTATLTIAGALEEAAERPQRDVRAVLVRVAAAGGVELAEADRAQPVLTAQLERRAVAPVERAPGGEGVHHCEGGEGVHHCEGSTSGART